MRKLLYALRALSPVDEFIIVVVAAFGPLVAYNIGILIQGAPPYYHIRNAEIVRLLIDELLMLFVLGGFLAARGWTLERIGLGPNLKETLHGLALFAVTDVLSRFAVFAAAALVPEFAKMEADMAAAKGALNPVLMVALSVVNPVWEEFFLCGFMITALKGRAPLTIAIASLAIRTIYHSYQGPLGLISILPFGIILTIYYLRTGRLWPLIVAHILDDFVPLIEYTQR